MAASKSSKYPYKWADGTWHSKPQGSGLNAPTGAKGVVRPSTLPPPPPGTYDPSLDYNAGAAQRGYDQTFGDAQTAYDQGQQDYGLGLGDLTRGRDRQLADLGVQRGDVIRQYGILGHQQAQHARQAGVTSGGLLALSQQKRDANQAHDVAPIDTAITRTGEDFTRGKLGLDLQNARQFGGFQGHQLTDPITGQPIFGALATQTARAGAENGFYQTAIGQQQAYQAQQNGYVSPLAQPGSPLDFMNKRDKPAKPKGLPPHFTGHGWW